MGKPFNQELLKLDETYKWALSTPIPEINNIQNFLFKKPAYIAGSGGSLSACHLFSILHQNIGHISSAVTPLELQFSKSAIGNSTNVIFISASGKNSDILLTFQTAIKSEPANILNICLQKDSLLSKQSSKYSISTLLEFENPAGKDGFLATNSLVAYFTLISRLYNQTPIINTLIPDQDYINEISDFTNLLYADFTITVLYSGWGKPAAIDLESKFSEAGLGNILLADYRNFGHGRHNWFDKKKEQSAIISLITPEDEDLANKTLNLLPKSIPILRVKTQYNSSSASLDLLAKSFYIVNKIGKLKNIDPGKPGVPDYGSKLYNLKYSKIFQNHTESLITEKAKNAIKRKLGNTNLNIISNDYLLKWNNAYNDFTKKLVKANFNILILDYDGTICDQLEKAIGPRKTIIEHLVRLLDNNIIIGIATGRGKSVRSDLQNIIPQQYWKQIIVGYYNCSQIGDLSNTNLPKINLLEENIISEINKILLEEPLINEYIKPTLRQNQLTIEIIDNLTSDIMKNIIIDKIKSTNIKDIQVLESSHSIDIVHLANSKLSIVDHCLKLTKQKKSFFLCIGDQGKWPGNDYQLLSSEFSLSVDKVSSDPNTCWNLSSTGTKCIDATIEYFNSIVISESFFKIKLPI